MSKKNLILGGVLIVLLAMAYAYQGPLKNWQKNYNKEKNVLEGINTLDISRIEISQPASAVTLIKEGDKWRIDGTRGFFVKENIMLSLLDALNSARDMSPEVISNNPDKKSEFNVDESGIHVVLKQGEATLKDFVIGNTTSDLLGTYLSMNEIGKTYIYKMNLRNVFDREDWYDKTIFATDMEKYNKIRFQYPNREFTVEKEADGDNETWSGTLPYAFNIDDEKLSKAIGIMSNLTAVEIPEQSFDNTGLEKHLMIIEASGDDVSNTLMVGDSNGEDLYYAKKGDSDNIYLITKEQRDELEKQIFDLR